MSITTEETGFRPRRGRGTPLFWQLLGALRRHYAPLCCQEKLAVQVVGLAVLGDELSAMAALDLLRELADQDLVDRLAGAIPRAREYLAKNASRHQLAAFRRALDRPPAEQPPRARHRALQPILPFPRPQETHR
jgi:hypothetical protein